MDTAPARILLIDDQEGFSQLMEQVLADTPTELVALTDPHEGLRQAMVWKPDLILLDIDMPDLTGLEILQQLRRMANTQTIPVIMFTARNDPQTVQRAVAQGATDYLVKPFETSALALKLNRVLDRVIFDSVALKALQTEKIGREFQVRQASGGGILLVDDDPVIGRVIQDLATELEIPYAWAANVGAALQQIQKELPTLVLLDISLPDQDGLNLLEQLRQRKETCTIPVLMLTASNEIANVERAKALGASGYMVKPFSVRALMQKIDDLLPLHD